MAARSREKLGKIERCTVEIPDPGESASGKRPVALVRWEDGEISMLGEDEVRELAAAFQRAGHEIPVAVQNGLRQFELYPLSQREHPADLKS
jgi:hypothetical protein